MDAINLVLWVSNFLVTVVYLVGTVALFGVPPSLSQSYYLYKDLINRKTNGKVTVGGWVFSAYMLFCGITIFNIMQQASYTELQGCLSSVAGCMFALVGVNPMFQENDRVMHYTYASIAFAAAFTWIILTGGLVWAVVGLSLGGVLGMVVDKPHRLFWLEMSAFIGTYTALFFQHIIALANN